MLYTDIFWRRYENHRRYYKVSTIEPSTTFKPHMTPRQRLLRYWLAYYIFQKIKHRAAEKPQETTAKTAKPAGNPKNRAQHDAIQEFAMLDVQGLDNQSELPSLHAKPNHSKWTRVYNLGRRIDVLAGRFVEDAIWVIPFDDIEAAFGRGLDMVAVMTREKSLYIARCIRLRFDSSPFFFLFFIVRFLFFFWFFISKNYFI